ncbi:purine-cytosine permease family protein [Rhodococcus koreensis]|uniref:purine-cytosine permease family protein n=1 Tax=Rhodococcus koreensis TaxID=99653 RepID=UPI00366B2237
MNEPTPPEVPEVPEVLEVPEVVTQPRAVEQHGVEPVPESERTVGAADLFQILINVMINPALILIGGFGVVAGLSFWAAIAAEVLGVFIAFTTYTIMATVGVDYGIPGIVSTRAFVGIAASRWVVSTIRAVSSAFWFAFQTIAASMGIVAVLKQLFHVNTSLILVSVLFAILQAIVALFGYDSLKWLSKSVFPVKVLVLGYLMYVMMTHHAPDRGVADVFAWNGTEGWNWPVFSIWVGATVAAWFTQVTDAADYCRYCSSRRSMWTATMSAALVGIFCAAFFGAYAAAASGATQANPFVYIPDLGIGSTTLILVLIVLVLDNWTINVLNIYTGGLALANLTVKLGRFWSTLTVAIVGTVLSVLPALVDDFSEVMDTIGSIYAPIVGVIVADYIWVKKWHIDIPALYEPHGPYQYYRGFNLIASAWVIIGLIIYFPLPATVLPTVVVAVVAGVGYVATVRLLKPKGAAFSGPRSDAVAPHASDEVGVF